MRKLPNLHRPEAQKVVAQVPDIQVLDLPIENMIPKIIHHIWVGEIPPPIEWIKTWYQKHPSWDHILWDNEKVFGRKWRNQKLVDHYRERKIWHGVADVVRYEILLEYGGFMPGADSICFKAVDELLTEPIAYAVYENERVRPGLITPLYACPKGDPFAEMLVDELGQIGSIGVPWRTTGNMFMQAMVVKHLDLTIKIWPSYFFNPVHHTGLTYKGDGTIYAQQLWGTTRGRYVSQK